MISLEAFIEACGNSRFPSNAYVTAAGFESLYVRMGSRYLPGDLFKAPTPNVLDIARVEAKSPGNGVFTKLVEFLLNKGLVVYVECVHNKRLAAKLERDGFTRVSHNDGAPSFFKKPEKIE